MKTEVVYVRPGYKTLRTFNNTCVRRAPASRVQGFIRDCEEASAHTQAEIRRVWDKINGIPELIRRISELEAENNRLRKGVL